MADNKPPTLPVVLELAPLPREQIGPFLLLGVGKTAAPKEIEASWAKRLIWARKKQIKTPLEDINWAKEMLLDAAKRVEADATSLNIDTIDGVLERLVEQYENSSTAVGCQPIDEEKDLSDYAPPVEIPDIEEIKKTIKIPEIPREFPIIRQMLDELAPEPIDPWIIEFAAADEDAAQ